MFIIFLTKTASWYKWGFAGYPFKLLCLLPESSQRNMRCRLLVGPPGKPPKAPSVRPEPPGSRVTRSQSSTWTSMSQPKTGPRGTRRPLGCKAGNCDQLDAFSDLPYPFGDPTQHLRLVDLPEFRSFFRCSVTASLESRVFVNNSFQKRS